ncbi:MAG: DegV family protein, partial [Clostridia bacterium]|nr:DegV family protein [Clostridia bacterium]
KARGEKKALEVTVESMKELGLTDGKVYIAHCMNETAALGLKALLNKELPKVEVTIYPTGGLCSFYAEKGGLMIGFEKG